MFVRKKLGLLAAAGALGLMATQAQAAPIGFFNTGTGAQGTADTHYTITANPSGATTAPANITKPEGNFPLPDFWWDDNSTSKWISPQVSYPNLGSDAAGYWSYTTTFTASSASDFISGKFWADNAGGDKSGVFLNGVQIGGAAKGYYQNTSQTFSSSEKTLLNTGATLNTLTFVVYNAPQDNGNPTGVRVESDPIPEPAFVQMSVLLAGGGMVALRRRRSRN